MGEGELPGLTPNRWSRVQPEASASAWATAAGLVKSLRPWQWYKQGVVFIALVFSLNALDPTAWARCAAGAGLFCGVAGAVYLFNDVCDVEEDRAHPTKRHRPIASGRVPVPTAIAAGTLLGSTSLAAAWWLSPAFFAILVLYAAQNAAYNALLRDVLFVDLMVVSAGFVLRAVAGVVLIGAPMSPWLVLCTFLAALFLGLGKRRAELSNTQTAPRSRSTLEDYHPRLVDLLLAMVAATLLLAYSLYTFSARSSAMMVTIPFAFYAVFRYAHLVLSRDMQRPETLFLDQATVANLVAWTGLVVLVLYLPDAPVPL